MTYKELLRRASVTYRPRITFEPSFVSWRYSLPMREFLDRLLTAPFDEDPKAAYKTAARLFKKWIDSQLIEGAWELYPVTAMADESPAIKCYRHANKIFSMLVDNSGKVQIDNLPNVGRALLEKAGYAEELPERH